MRTLGLFCILPLVLLMSFAFVRPDPNTAGTCYMVKQNTNGQFHATCNQEPNTECQHETGDHCEERVLQTFPQKFRCQCSAIKTDDTTNNDCRCDGIATDSGGFYHSIQCAGACWVCGTGVDKCKPHTVLSGQSGPACECIGVGDG